MREATLFAYVSRDIISLHLNYCIAACYVVLIATDNEDVHYSQVKVSCRDKLYQQESRALRKKSTPHGYIVPCHKLDPDPSTTKYSNPIKLCWDRSSLQSIADYSVCYT